jgi:spore maturation protein CgeB
MATIYQAGKEADYFSSKDELIEKVKLYVENDSLRRQVAEGGNLRVVKDGHDIVSRMSKVITFVGDGD